MKNISLSPNRAIAAKGKECEKTVSGGCLTKELDNNNNLQDEREKFVYKTVYEKLTPLEAAILKAKPCEEPDRAKIAWGDQAPIIPELEQEAFHGKSNKQLRCKNTTECNKVTQG